MDEPEMKIIPASASFAKSSPDASGGKNYIATVWGRGYVLSRTARGVQPRELTTNSAAGDLPIPRSAARRRPRARQLPEAHGLPDPATVTSSLPETSLECCRCAPHHIGKVPY
jgi:hypothetical protein